MAGEGPIEFLLTTPLKEEYNRGNPLVTEGDTNYHTRATQEFIFNLDLYFRQRNRAEILYRIEVKLLTRLIFFYLPG